MTSEDRSPEKSQKEAPERASERSQWECLRQNIGTWHGSFTQFSPAGEQVKDTPSTLTLTETEPDQTIELTLERFPTGEEKKVNQLKFTAPGPAPAIYFFENGSFSQGSAQWSSFGQFGAEISLKVDDRRVRYVIMYEATSHYTSQIKYVTLICETQKNGTQFTGSALKAEQLLGEWRGTASMICASGELVAAGTSQWRLSKELKLVCEEQFDNCAQTYSSQALCIQSDRQDTLTSERLISVEATEETEDKSQLSYQLMLLPKGAYVLLPQEIKKERAFRIEVGWLSGEGVRSRFIRHYDTRGVWIDSVLIEDKMASV
ncbi:MAG: DUF3598 family protein [Phormidesmis sp.]